MPCPIPYRLLHSVSFLLYSVICVPTSSLNAFCYSASSQKDINLNISMFSALSPTMLTSTPLVHWIFFYFTKCILDCFVFACFFSSSRIQFSSVFHILQGTAEIPFLPWNPVWKTELNTISTAFFFVLVPGNAIWIDETYLVRILHSFKYRGCIFYLNTQGSVKSLGHKRTS